MKKNFFSKKQKEANKKNKRKKLCVSKNTRATTTCLDNNKIDTLTQK